jgi:hypothetical protein
MASESTTRCEYCATADETVTTRPGRGAQALCEACDAWITERMREITVEVPDAIAGSGRGSDVGSDAGRVLALDPALEVDVALEFATGVSYEAIGQLEAAGFETVDDLWTADRDDLLAVPHVGERDVDAIVETISTRPDRDLDDVVEDIPGFNRLDEDDAGSDDGEDC